jgi:endonuclease YncB( thermonuclease family)
LAERKQHGGEFAKNFVFTMDKEVEVTPQGGPDRYGRTVAIAYFSSGESLQELLLKNGWVWVCPRYCKNCADWEVMQEDAKQTGRGVNRFYTHLYPRYAENITKESLCAFSR